MKSAFIILLVLLFFACKQPVKFDKEMWHWAAHEPDFSNRDLMVKDLTENYKLKGMHYHDIIALLDSPQFTDSLKVTYEVRLDFDMIDPIGGKRLVFFLNKDSVVTDFKIEKWRNGRHK